MPPKKVSAAAASSADDATAPATPGGSGTPATVLSTKETQLLSEVLGMMNDIPDIDYNALARKMNVKYGKNCRAAVKKLFIKLRGTDADDAGEEEHEDAGEDGDAEDTPAASKKTPAKKTPAKKAPATPKKTVAKAGPKKVVAKPKATLTVPAATKAKAKGKGKVQKVAKSEELVEDMSDEEAPDMAAEATVEDEKVIEDEKTVQGEKAVEGEMGEKGQQDDESDLTDLEDTEMVEGIGRLSY
ncbi:hypothetical protein EG329_006388 [Mollisiaceae sp. DMI_Dod_QoI]|nr:hypothetical protein EG329_006388 [Helotiales sp. DMI_Dod_QoI]